MVAKAVAEQEAQTAKKETAEEPEDTMHPMPPPETGPIHGVTPGFWTPASSAVDFAGKPARPQPSTPTAVAPPATEAITAPSVAAPLTVPRREPEIVISDVQFTAPTQT